MEGITSGICYIFDEILIRQEQFFMHGPTAHIRRKRSGKFIQYIKSDEIYRYIYNFFSSSQIRISPMPFLKIRHYEPLFETVRHLFLISRIIGSSLVNGIHLRWEGFTPLVARSGSSWTSHGAKGVLRTIWFIL